MQKFGIGQSVLRVEDRRLLTGDGRFVDDLALEGMAHAVILRSPVAHGLLKSVVADQAKAAPGVLAVLTAADWQAAGLGNIPIAAAVVNRDGSDMLKREHPGLAREKVRHVGEPIALVVAETADQARDALDLIELDIEELPAAVMPRAAQAEGAARLHDDVPSNRCFDFVNGDGDAVDAALAAAAHVIELDLVNNKIVPNAMETRGAIAKVDADGAMTLWGSLQNVFQFRKLLCDLFGVAPDQLRVVAHDVGGGFGAKNQVQPEHALTLFAARVTGRPVKWISDRSEAFLSDAQGRAHETLVRLALDADHRFLALDVQSDADLGAYCSTNGPMVPTRAFGIVLGGAYRLPAIRMGCRGAYTNTVPTDAYRGAGRPEATYLMERVIDLAADQLGVDRFELRRKNLIRPEELPARAGFTNTVDAGNFPGVLDLALDKADFAGFASRKTASEARGMLRGFGIGSYMEGTLGLPVERARVALDADGGATITIGTQSTGHSHETTFAQLVWERLGIPVEKVRFVQADSAVMPMGNGHGGSRSLHIGGTALWKAADEVIEKGKRLAAHVLEAAVVDIEFDAHADVAGGRFVVAGTDRSVGLPQLAGLTPDQLPEGEEAGLDGDVTHEREAINFPNGCHVAEVEIDPDTGRVALARYTVVDDFGTILNPMVVKGQVIGGVAQGVGQALLENTAYEAGSGQLIAGSFMDYTMPRADDLPDIGIDLYEEAPSATNPLGSKGCGEAGATAAPPAIVNAVVDALKPYGVKHIDMPITAEAVWRAIHGGAKAAAE